MRLAPRAALLLLAAAACAGPPDSRLGSRAVQSALPVTTPAAAASAQSDSARIAKLEAEARALARATGCRQDAECAVAPVGSRACGGPRTYVPYCRATTDTAALNAKLAQLKRAEDDYLRKNEMMSTCEMRTPPPVMVEGGRCTSVAPAAGSRGPQ
ncbi:MAG: hypothetical protein JWM27_610 [Gemmatimonadetes bacterium]|nr:hypothetical protein [Gemmatimonadota bacterium]